MRRSECCAFVFLSCAACTLDAQTAGVDAAGENRVSVEARMGLMIPALAHMRRSSTPRVIAKRAHFTEYVVICAVSANTSWELVVSGLPHGVAIRDERGEWKTSLSDSATVSRGRPAHFLEVLLLVRVWREADADWESRLNLRVKPIESDFPALIN